MAQLLKTCRASYSNGSVIPNNGIDHVVWCMERAVDPAITAGTQYFATRSPDPTGQSESATEPSTWNKSHIRTLWRKNLYGH